MPGGMSIGPGLGLTSLTGGGVPVGALLLNGVPVMLNGRYITFNGAN
jgi:hypothetical protein